MIIKVQNKVFLTAKIIVAPWQSQCVTRRHCRAETSGSEYYCLQVTPQQNIIILARTGRHIVTGNSGMISA